MGEEEEEEGGGGEGGGGGGGRGGGRRGGAGEAGRGWRAGCSEGGGAVEWDGDGGLDRAKSVEVRIDRRYCSGRGIIVDCRHACRWSR